MSSEAALMPTPAPTMALAHGAQDATTAALAAQSQARIQARVLVALNRPRNPDTVRQNLLNLCESSAFAESAVYVLPRGQGVEGLSIRFAEEAARLHGNLDIETPVIAENDERMVVRVSCTDLETNTSYMTDLSISKTVERKSKKGEVIRERLNSKGETIYIVRANESDFTTKKNAEISKAMRTQILRLLPEQLKAEAKARLDQVRQANVPQDPEARRRKLVDAFGKIGIDAEALTRFVGRPLSTLTAEDFTSLQGVWSAVKEGAVSREEFYARGEVAPEEGGGGEDKPKKSKTQSTKERLDATRKGTSKGSKGRQKPKPPPKEERTAATKSGDELPKGPADTVSDEEHDAAMEKAAAKAESEAQQGELITDDRTPAGLDD